MSSKIRIKIGEIELEYEGTDDFLKNELLGLLKDLTQLSQIIGGYSPHGVTRKSTSNVDKSSLSTSSFAQKTNAKQGSDLALAACYFLSLSGHESFTSADISKEMRKARAYFKESYSANLSNYLKTLVKSGQINPVSSNSYSLPQKEIDKANSVIHK